VLNPRPLKNTTPGISTWLFLDVMKKDSLTYMIQLFVLVILVALAAILGCWDWWSSSLFSELNKKDRTTPD
jgi:hypothetical protein